MKEQSWAPAHVASAPAWPAMTPARGRRRGGRPSLTSPARARAERPRVGDADEVQRGRAAAAAPALEALLERVHPQVAGQRRVVEACAGTSRRGAVERCSRRGQDARASYEARRATREPGTFPSGISAKFGDRFPRAGSRPMSTSATRAADDALTSAAQ